MTAQCSPLYSLIQTPWDESNYGSDIIYSSSNILLRYNGPPLNLICRGYGWRDGEASTIGQCTCSSDWDVPSSKLIASKHYQRSKAPLTSLTLPTSYLGSSHLKWTRDTSISRQLAQVVQCKACFITTCCVFHVANWDVQIPAAFNHHS